MSRTKTLSIILLLAFAGDITGIYSSYSILHFVCKPLLMLFITGIFISELKEIDFMARLFISAFFFSWMGDVFLMFDEKNPLFFMLGLASFLIAHIIYIFSFYKLAEKKSGISIKNILKGTPFYGLALLIFYLLYPNLNELKIPVLIYTLVISTMVVFALNLNKKIINSGWQMIFSGAIFFMISDSALAFNKFYSPVPLSALVIMSTYILAQFLIMKGAAKSLNNR
jgi:uncharacterized membrane protein YhhN